MRLFGKPAGNRLDIAELASRYYDDVWRFCARQVGPELGSDAAQETFITAMRRLDSFKAESTVKTWLFGIALNQCRNLRRKTGREEPVDWIEPTPSLRADNPELAIDREALRVALLKLSEEHREAVLLHELEGLTYQEIAEVVGVPVGTVKSRISNAFDRLRRDLVAYQEGAR